MSTPALVLNEDVVSSGKVLKVEDVKKIIRKYHMLINLMVLNNRGDFYEN